MRSTGRRRYRRRRRVTRPRRYARRRVGYKRNRYESKRPATRLSQGPIDRLCVRWRESDIVPTGSGVVNFSRNYVFGIPVTYTQAGGWDYFCIRGIKVTFTQVVETSAQASGANTRNPTIYLSTDFDLIADTADANTFARMCNRGAKQRALLPNRPVSIYYVPALAMLDTIAGGSGPSYATTVMSKQWVDNSNLNSSIWSGLRVYIEDLMAGVHVIHVDVRAFVALKQRT